MKKRIVSLLLCLFPLVVMAQETEPDVSIKINGDLTQEAGEENGVLVLVRGTARIEGRVEVLVVVDGTADLIDAHVGQLTVVQGKATLEGATRIDEDVRLINATMDRSADATIGGEILEGTDARWGPGAAVFGALFGLGYMLAILVAGVLLAMLVPHTVRRTGMAITHEPLPTLGAAFILWFVMPFLAVFAIATVFGMPLGIGYLVFALPLMAFVGYIISGIRLGDLIMEKWKGTVEFERPIQATVIGLLVLLVIGWIPIIGFFLTPIAVFAGTGALALAIWRVIVRKETWREGPALSEAASS